MAAVAEAYMQGSQQDSENTVLYMYKVNIGEKRVPTKDVFVCFILD